MPLVRLEIQGTPSSAIFGAVSQVRVLRNGSVLVADSGSRVILSDPALSTKTVIASWPTGFGYVNARGIIGWRGDSTIVVEGAPNRGSDAGRVAVLTPDGSVARMVSIESAEIASCLRGGDLGSAGSDSSGRIVCQMPPKVQVDRAPMGLPVVRIADSSALVRLDVNTWEAQVIGYLRTPTLRMAISSDGNGTVVIAPMINAIPVADGWALLPDGRIAIIRAQDYHLEWSPPSQRSPNTVAIGGRALTNVLSVGARSAIVDSLRRVLDSVRDLQHSPSAPVWRPRLPADTSRIRRIVFERPEITRDLIGMAARVTGAATAPLLFLPAEDLAEQMPPLVPGGVLADDQGRLWVCTTRSVGRERVYDVMDAGGALVSRVLVPQGESVVGFGQDGMVYLAVPDGAGSRLLRARIPRGRG